jgi:MFS family permease
LLAAFVGRPPVPVPVSRAAPFGWSVAALLALVTLVDRVEANIVAGALPAIQEEFGIGDAAGGGLATAAALAGLLLVIPAGRLADTRTRTRLLAFVVLSWSVLTLGSGVATTFVFLLVMRVLLGAAAQMEQPLVNSLIADYYPPKSRVRAYGIDKFAYFGGLPLGVVLGGVLTQAFGWRAAFFAVAIPGVVIAFLVSRMREPARGIGDRIGALAGVAAGEAVPAQSNQQESLPPEQPPIRQVFAELWSVRTYRYVIVGLAITFFGTAGLFFWLPSYLSRTQGLEEGAAAAIAGSVGFFGILVGTVIGSWLGDRYHRVRPNWRLQLGGVGLLLFGINLAIAILVPIFWLQVLLLFTTNCFSSAALPNLTAAVADVIPARIRGLGFSATQFLLILGGALGPGLVGLVSQLTGSLDVAFLALLIPITAGAVVVLAGRSGYDADADAATTASLATP